MDSWKLNSYKEEHLERINSYKEEHLEREDLGKILTQLNPPTLFHIPFLSSQWIVTSSYPFFLPTQTLALYANTAWLKMVHKENLYEEIM